VQHKREKKTTLSSKKEHSMNDKQIYMQLEEESNTQQKNGFIKSELKEQPFEVVLDKFTKDIDINIVDGMAQITIPEPLIQVFLTFFKQLEKQLDGGITR